MRECVMEILEGKRKLWKSKGAYITDEENIEITFDIIKSKKRIYNESILVDEKKLKNRKSLYEVKL